MEEPAEIFNNENFSPDDYVSEICRRCVGIDDIRQELDRIKNLSHETNSILKKNVYRNYTLFIDTSKEISRLEGDMHQLSHSLSEQSALLATLGSASIFQNQESLSIKQAEDVKEKEEDNLQAKRKQMMSDIAEKIECTFNLLDESGRYLLYEGDLTELDSLENTPIAKFHAYLLSDVFLIVSTIENRRNPARYKVETVYHLTNLAIVNVKHVQNALKLLSFPDTKVFQATSSQTKDEWLEKFDEAKKLLLHNQNRKRGSVSAESKPPVKNNSVEVHTNPFDEEEGEYDDDEIIPEWILEVAEDLDVLIVERHFEEAYALIEKTRHYMKETLLQNEIMKQDILGKVDLRVQTLTQILTKELEVTPEKSHQGGLRAARISVRLLNILQKSTQACDLFLKLCSHLLKTQLKRVIMTTTDGYVKQLCSVFFINLCDMTKEFQQQAFPDNPACASSFVVWCTAEVSEFISVNIKPIFINTTNLITLKKCVEYLHYFSKRLTNYGLDITYQIDGQLRTVLTNAISHTKNKLLENVDRKIVEEKWHMISFKSSQQASKLVLEFEELGIVGIEKYVSDNGCFKLTNITIWFVKTLIQFIESTVFNIPNIMYDVEIAISTIMNHYVKHILSSFTNDKFKREKLIIINNGEFLVEDFIPYCDVMYKKHFGSSSKQLKQIQKELEEFLVEHTVLS